MFSPTRWMIHVLLSLPIFLLMAEWLRTFYLMSEWTGLHIYSPFIWATACFLFIWAWQVESISAWLIQLLLNGSVSFLFVIDMFAKWDELASFAQQPFVWLGTSGGEMLMGAELRTFLFLLIWSLLAWLLQWFTLQGQLGVWFAFGTIVYLVSLQLFVSMDNQWGIVRAFGTALLLLSINCWSQLGLQVWSNRHVLWRWLLVCGVVSSFCVTAGYMLSKNTYSESLENKKIEWSWSGFDELFLKKSQSTFLSGSQGGQIGYDSDDRTLGVSLHNNSEANREEEMLFTAITDELTYWRGESKSHYTGKGWEADSNGAGSLGDAMTFQLGEGEYAHNEGSLSDDKSELIEQEINFSGPLSKLGLDATLFAGGRVVEFVSLYTDDGRTIASEQIVQQPSSERLSLVDPDIPLLYYKMKVRTPRYDVNHLRQVDRIQQVAPSGEVDGITDPQHQAVSSIQLSGDELKKNLQLPNSLPKRVTALAEEITADAENRYDRVTAIANHLRQNYTYQLDSTRKPAPYRDFVDHFLFTQQFGYCNHFSTALVVMLRSIGIPARWVKGFSPGDVISETEDPLTGKRQYTVQVLNQNAHSWVEVYFPGAGWISFDPTPGFGAAAGDMAVGGLLETAALDGGDSVAEETLGASTGDSNEGTLPEQKDTDSTAAQTSGAGSGILQSITTFHLIMVIVGAGCLVLFAFLARRMITLAKRRASLYLFGRRLYAQLERLETGEHVEMKPVLHMLWQKVYESYGIRRDEQTWREYVLSLPIEQGHPKRETLDVLVQMSERADYAHESMERLPVWQLRRVVGSFLNHGFP